MSKYTREELVYMANQVLKAETEGRQEARLLIMAMSHFTGLHPDHVREKIIELAELREVA